MGADGTWTGAEGPAGPAGADGMDGAAGAAGADGAEGPAGPAGADGMDGGAGSGLSDTDPATVIGSGASAGTSTDASRSDHQHHLADGAVTQSKLSDSSVHTSKIADSAVTAAKIPNQEISHVKLGSSVAGVDQAAGRIQEADGAGAMRWADKAAGTDSGLAVSDDTPDRVGESGESAGTSATASRSDHKHQLAAGVERLVEQIPALGIKTNDIRIDDTSRERGRTTATDANHGFSVVHEERPAPDRR